LSEGLGPVRCRARRGKQVEWPNFAERRRDAALAVAARGAPDEQR